jgi:PiT family inorganic phosphate transporter
MNSLLSPDSAFGAGVNWAKVGDTVKALFFSPLIGFVVAGLLLLLAKAVLRNPALFKAPEGNAPPPGWIRGLLVFTWRRASGWRSGAHFRVTDALCGSQHTLIVA